MKYHYGMSIDFDLELPVGTTDEEAYEIASECVVLKDSTIGKMENIHIREM